MEPVDAQLVEQCHDSCRHVVDPIDRRDVGTAGKARQIRSDDIEHPGQVRDLRQPDLGTAEKAMLQHQRRPATGAMIVKLVGHDARARRSGSAPRG
jgi:hypothetical protein